MAVVWVVLGLPPPPEPSADEAANLLGVALVVVLVVAGVILLSIVLRPLLPPAPAPLTEAEQDDLTLRHLGLRGEAERSLPNTTGRAPDVIPFPRTGRDPILDEDGRVYRDPIIAARLKHVLSGTRRERRRPSDILDPIAGRPLDRDVGPRSPLRTSGPRLVRADDRPPVRHTERVPAATKTVGPVDRAQEPDPMPASDIDSPSDDLPEDGVGVTERLHADRSTGARDRRPPEVIEGSPPSSADLERLAGGPPQPRSKVVPFIPRQTPAGSESEQQQVDSAEVAAFTATVRELLFCANVGEYLHGFALYSDRYLFRFMDDSGMTVDEFREAFEGAPAKEAEAWTRLSQVSDVRRLDDGRLAAVVSYLDGDQAGGAERYTFVFAASRGLWLIDDIEPV